MSVGDIIIILSVVIAVTVGIVLYLGKKNYAKNLEAQSFINQYKTVTPILVIDKKFERPSQDNLPKNIYEKLPKSARLRKVPIVKAKVGSQITTLMCDKSVYDALVPKKTIKVELAGVYISSIIGLELENKRNKTWSEKRTVWLNNRSKQSNK